LCQTIFHNSPKGNAFKQRWTIPKSKSLESVTQYLKLPTNVLHVIGENKTICEPSNCVVVVPSQEIAQVVWKLVHWFATHKKHCCG
jgi:hypothetical protein